MKVNVKKGTIDEIKISRLNLTVKGAVIVVLEKQLEKKFIELKSVLDQYYQNNEVAYSFKTNNVPGICLTLKNLGAKAEVVSGFEYYLAKKIGFKSNEIIFNGPYKSDPELEKALRGGSLVNINDSGELKRVQQIAKKLKKTVFVGIRLNSRDWPSHFGFNIENKEALRVCREISKDNRIELKGLHMHVGFNVDTTDLYKNLAIKISDFALKINERFNFELTYLDMGGGFPAGGKPYGKKSWRLPAIEDYVRVITDEVKIRFPEMNLKIILEPGRFLVDEAVILIASVIESKKKLRHQYLFVNTTLNQLPLVKYREQEVMGVRRDLRRKRKFFTKIYGVSCREDDVLVSKVRLPGLDAGDNVIFFNIGAYNIAWASQFCYPRPVVLMIDKNNKIKTLRREENYNDFIIRDVI